MQRTKSKLLSILLILVMLLSLLPTTALAASPDASNVYVDGGKNFYNSTRLYYKNGDPDGSFTGTSTEFNAAYEPSTGTLTLKGYNGKGIKVGGVGRTDITVVLEGTNFINDGSLEHAVGGNITITSDSGGKLSITRTLSNGNPAIGIETGWATSYETGNVTITGDAKVTIDMTHDGTSTFEKAYGIFAKDNITISDAASVDITCATPNNTAIDASNCNGLRAGKDVTINTTGEVKIDVTKAGKNDAYSIGVYPSGNAILTKVGDMAVEWKNHGSNTSYTGGAIYGGGSFDTSTHAVNVDTNNRYASYRYGTPHYTVTVKNGTLTGPGVKYANGSGNFLENDTVNIKPDTKTSESTEEIPFKEWTAEGVTITNSDVASNSFTVPANAVTVTATHSPFVGKPSFTRESGATGTIAFKTAVKPNGGTEYFQYVEVGKETDPYGYQSISSQPTTTSTVSPYEYSVSASTGYTSVIQYLTAGEYRMAVTLNSTRYLSEKFTVDYTAAPAPTATVGGVTIDGMTGTGIADKDVVITLTNDTFASALSGNWITNLPTGLSQSLSRTDDTHAKITVSGNPSVASSDALVIKIPAANLVTSTSNLDVTSNPSAKYNITAPATSITDSLVPVTDLTGKTYNESAQEPTFGGSLTPGTDYTVSYTVKSGSTGTFNSDGKPVGAGTYVVTVTGKGSYTGSFIKEFEIGKANPVYAAPTAKTGLAYTGSALDLIDAGTVTKGGEMQYKLDSGSYGTTIPTATDAGNYTVHFKINENDNYNAVAETQVGTGAINIAPANQNAPTGLGVAAPIASGGNGKITGTTIAMEYSTDSGFTSPAGTTCTDTETEVAPGIYYVRYKADANHNAGTAATVTVPAYGATKYTVTVTYDANGTASADKTANVVAGETVTLTATPNSGYVFDKWDNKTPAGLTIGADGKFTMPSENVSVKAIFKGAALTGTASITGTLKYGQELTASLASTNNTGTLTYKWYRSGETAEIETNTTGKYTLVAADIGKTITVKITSSVQSGEFTDSTTGTIEKADGPAAPTAFTLTFTPNADGTTFTATIPTVTGGEYSFDGTNYSATNTKADCAANSSYTGYVRIAATSTHKASAPTSSTQTSPKLTVATPTFTPNGVSGFTGPQSVTITCATTGAKIYYTTDGTTPTASSTEYTTALSLTSTTTVKAIAVKTGMNDSAIATATFTKYSGGGGGGGSYTPSYTVSVDKTENGTITVSPKSASKGDTVTITVKPDKGYELEMLKVLDKDGDALKLTEKNGKYTFKMPSGKVTVKGSFVEEAPVQIFKDVPVDAYYYEAVKWAAEKGITGGIGNGLFGPNQPCTRAQIVTFLWRAAGSPAPKHMSSFADVPADAFYAKAVAWAVENGITGGTGDGKFSPDATCTRAQSVTFLYRAAGSPKVSGSAEFGDVATNAYYADAVAWAAKNGITGGIGGGLFGSGNDCTRGQIVTFLYRAYNK